MTKSDSLGQLNQFDELSNKMFFNIFIHKPDTSVFDFVKRYFPYFTEKYEPGGWTMYPPGPEPEFIHTVHSLIFKKHPFFDAKFREGRLDLLASEEKDGTRGIRDFQLWFMFDTKDEAQLGFNKLSKMFEPLSKSKRKSELANKTIGEYSKQQEFDEIDSVQIILTIDELHDNKYKIFFRIGAFTYSE